MHRLLKAFFLATALTGASVGAFFILSPTSVDTSHPELEQREEVVYYKGSLFTGVLTERYPDGKPAKVSQYRSGLMHGESREYALTGALRHKWNYKAGKKHGLQHGWFIEGPKRFEHNFAAGLLEGLQMEYQLNGSLFRRQVFAAGVEIERKILYPTAEVFSNYVKKDGRIYGLDGGALCFENKKEGEK